MTGSGELPILNQYTNAVKLYFKGFSSTADFPLYSYSNLVNVTFDDKMQSLGDGLFSGTKVEYFTIPKNVKNLKLNPFDNGFYMKGIYVDKANPYFTDINGILYSKDLKTLYVYPGNHGEEYVTVPNFVEYIKDNAFTTSSIIKYILIHPNVKRIGFQFYRMEKLEFVNIQNKNLPSLEILVSSDTVNSIILQFNPLPKISCRYCIIFKHSVCSLHFINSI